MPNRPPLIEVPIMFHCEHKRRRSDDHDFIRTVKRVRRADGANRDIGKVRTERCSHCNGNMVEGDVLALPTAGKRVAYAAR